MIARCTRVTGADYPDYGGRGIRVCDAWVNSFDAFLADVGPKPGPEYSIDRINNDGNYEPGNVRWATVIQQAGNKRNTSRLTLGGTTLSVPKWSERTGIGRAVIWSRLTRLGWSVERALTTPVRKPSA
jgi:hypothetical protein